jgi:7-carboxy-7-deazaguanine synthase
VNPDVVKILDLKCPGSKMVECNDFSNLDRLIPGQDEVKFVLTNYDDFKWTENIIYRFELLNRFTILLSPAWGILDPRNIAKWILEKNLQVKLQVPIHKLLWSNKNRGV